MRTLATATAFAAAFCAATAQARDRSWYIEADAGAAMVPDRDLVLTGGPAGLHSKLGADVGMAVGYDFGKFRLESEASVRRASFSELTAGAGFGGVAAPVAYSGAALRGHTDALSVMLDGLFDFGPDDGTHFLFGGGVGVARLRNMLVAGGIPYYGAVKTGLAWQLLAGVAVPLDRSWDLGIKYRYFNATDAERFVDGRGRVLHDRFSSHSLLGTLTYNFGGDEAPAVVPPPPAPPPAPPPPPPPPPAPAPVCNKGPFIVFFDWDSADITGEAATVLDGAVQAYGNCPSVPVMLAGYADRSGPVRYNLGLSARRDAAVTRYLTGRGIPAAAISSHAFGESSPRVPTPDGVRELQNRRVEITYGPGSGN